MAKGLIDKDSLDAFLEAAVGVPKATLAVNRIVADRKAQATAK